MLSRVHLSGRSLKSLGFATVLITVVALGAISHVNAIARGYLTDDTGLQTGMVASLSTDGDSKVERADQNNSQRVVGVVTTYDKSTVTVASGDSKLLVENEGEVSAYVSDMGGAIERGSLLVLSPLRGILMKADEHTASPIIAIAAENITESSESADYQVTRGDGAKNTKITKLRVNLNQQGMTGYAGSDRSALADLGKAIVGKDVGEIRVAIALVIFVLVLIAEGGIIYGAVTSAITALGRNPMARKIIKREMLHVTIVAIAVLTLGLGAVYGVLWM